MDIKHKRVWDLTTEEIDYIYHNLHMNNYVYAALKTYHGSNIPYNKNVSIKKNSIPSCIKEYAGKLVSLTPYFGNEDPTIIRTNYTFYVYNFFKSLNYIKPDEVCNILKFIASISYIPILADKNDNFPLWRFDIVRKIDKETLLLFEMINKNIDFDKLFQKCENIKTLKNQYIKKCTNDSSPVKRGFIFIYLVQSIIIMNENNYDKEIIKKKWKILENIMRQYEFENKLLINSNKSNILDKEQFRYQNCVYLYGGDFFRRIGDNDTAFEWYTKNIFHSKLPSMMNYFMTDMRICERLLQAYKVTKKNQHKDILKELFFKCMYINFQNIAWFSNKVLNILRSNQKNDLSQYRIYDKNKLSTIYSGEQTRELFFLSLLYNEIINNEDFSEINYSNYLIIKDNKQSLQPINKIQLNINIIQHKFGKKTINFNINEFIVICLVKNGEEYINSFIKHYQKLGAKHIFFISNSSSDNTEKEIMKHNHVSIYTTNLSFKNNECKIRKEMINVLSKNKWCLCIDIDEFFDYPFSDKISMKNLLTYLNKNKYTAVVSYMLDMFPKKSIKKRKNKANFIEEHIYYDLSSINRKTYPLNFKECNNNIISNNNIKFLSGGIRQKQFGSSNPFFLIKHPLLYIDDKIKPFTHPHFCNNAKIADITCLLKHYKFTNTFFKNIKKNEYKKDYPDKSVSEYEKYIEYLKKHKKIKLYTNDSKKYKNINKLINSQFIITSKKYIDYINQ